MGQTYWSLSWIEYIGYFHGSNILGTFMGQSFKSKKMSNFEKMLSMTDSDRIFFIFFFFKSCFRENHERAMDKCWIKNTKKLSSTSCFKFVSSPTSIKRQVNLFLDETFYPITVQKLCNNLFVTQFHDRKSHRCNPLRCQEKLGCLWDFKSLAGSDGYFIFINFI